MQKRYVREDGLVGVVVTDNYGCGWSTWNNSEWREDLTMHPALVEAVLKGEKHKYLEASELKQLTGLPAHAHIYVKGAANLSIKWMKPGTTFKLVDNDGREDIVYFDEASITV